jgi:hypothetical protein
MVVAVVLLPILALVQVVPVVRQFSVVVAVVEQVTLAQVEQVALAPMVVRVATVVQMVEHQLQEQFHQVVVAGQRTKHQVPVLVVRYVLGFGANHGNYTNPYQGW